jgi:hypothetical protein
MVRKWSERQSGPMARTVRDLSAGDDGARSSLAGAARSGGAAAASRSTRVRSRCAACASAGLRMTALWRPAPRLFARSSQAKAILQAAGAHLVDFRPVSPDDLIYLWMAVISSDAATTLQGQLAGETVCKQLVSRRCKRHGCRICSSRRWRDCCRSKGDARLGRLLKSLGRKPVEELWRLTAQKAPSCGAVSWMPGTRPTSMR